MNIIQFTVVLPAEAVSKEAISTKTKDINENTKNTMELICIPKKAKSIILTKDNKTNNAVIIKLKLMLQ
jgi:hypothetical protein